MYLKLEKKHVSGGTRTHSLWMPPPCDPHVDEHAGWCRSPARYPLRHGDGVGVYTCRSTGM